MEISKPKHFFHQICRLAGSLALGLSSHTTWAQTPNVAVPAATVVPSAPQVTAPNAHAVVAADCCKGLLGAPARPLPLEEKGLTLDEQSPQFDFGQGLQSYLLLQLPKFEQAYSVELKNLPLQQNWWQSARLTQIALVVHTLNADLQTTRRYHYSQMKKRGTGYEKIVFFNPKDEQDRYLLVYGDLSAQPESMLLSKQDVVFVGTGFYMGGADTQVTFQPGDKGLIQIKPVGVPAPK